MANAKKHKFNASLVVGDKTYEPGRDVPIGTGKNQLNPEEITRLEATFGRYTGDGVVKAPDPATGDVNALKAENASLKTQVKDLSDEVEKLKADNTELAADLDDLINDEDGDVSPAGAPDGADNGDDQPDLTQVQG